MGAAGSERLMVDRNHEIKTMANETKEAALRIIQLLNEFDVHAAGFFSSIRHIQVVVNNMNNSIDSIMKYLSQQSNLIVSNKEERPSVED